jgi:hypothetical protein
VFMLEVDCFIWLKDCCFQKNQIGHVSIEQFKISKFIDRDKSVFFSSI